MKFKKLLKPQYLNPGDKSKINQEEPLEDIKFTVHKFSDKERPADKRQTLIICCFSEFGCELVGCLYCLPQLIQSHTGRYKIAIGWYGRAYLYKHLVDEFWEIKEENQWLRNYARAFHHDSKNLKKLEKQLSDQGLVVPSDYLGRLALITRCLDCGNLWPSSYKVKECNKCKSNNVLPSPFGDVKYWKEKAIRIPSPSAEKMEEVKKYLKPKTVAIFARGRKVYGRNLQPEFYVKLIELLESMGYNPIWMGEKINTLPCPVDRILDFSRMEESRDLETTLAIIKQCEFTIQFWTASTRLAGIMGVPYILFESPDQIWGMGQEGIRRNLCDFGPRKLSVNHFLNVYNNNKAGIEVVRNCIKEIQKGNFEDSIGLVQKNFVIESLRKDNKERIGDA